MENIIENPRSLPEWALYISTQSGDSLLEQAKAVNTPEFVRLLTSEGYEPFEVTSVLRMFAERLLQDDQALPGRIPGCYLELASLLENDLDALEV